MVSSEKMPWMCQFSSFTLVSAQFWKYSFKMVVSTSRKNVEVGQIVWHLSRFFLLLWNIRDLFLIRDQKWWKRDLPLFRYLSTDFHVKICSALRKRSCVQLRGFLMGNNDFGHFGQNGNSTLKLTLNGFSAIAPMETRRYALGSERESEFVPKMGKKDAKNTNFWSL